MLDEEGRDCGTPALLKVYGIPKTKKSSEFSNLQDLKEEIVRINK